MSLEDWARINHPTEEQLTYSIIELLTQENEILRDMGYEGERLDDTTWFERTRNWIGRKLVRLGFGIAPDVEDEYRD